MQQGVLLAWNTAYFLAKPVILLTIYHITNGQTRFKSQNKSRWPSWLEQNNEKRHAKKYTNNGIRISFHTSVYSDSESGSVPA